MKTQRCVQLNLNIDYLIILNHKTLVFNSMFNYYYSFAEKTAAFNGISPMTSSAAATSMPQSMSAYKNQETSKFGFRYDFLVHSIDDLVNFL